MPYITRNKDNKIIGIFENKQYEGQEFIAGPVELDDLRDYRQKRASEYPPIGDQLDALWAGGSELEEMRAKIAAIKSKYPKPD